jgi:hypothetical protein
MNFIVFSMNIQILLELTKNLNQKIYLEKNEKVETVSGRLLDWSYGAGVDGPLRWPGRPRRAGTHERALEWSPHPRHRRWRGLQRRFGRWGGLRPTVWASARWGHHARQLEQGGNSPRRCSTGEAAEWGWHGGILLAVATPGDKVQNDILHEL